MRSRIAVALAAAAVVLLLLGAWQLYTTCRLINSSTNPLASQEEQAMMRRVAQEAGNGHPCGGSTSSALPLLALGSALGAGSAVAARRRRAS